MFHSLLDLLKNLIHNQSALIIVAGFIAPYFVGYLKSATGWQKNAIVILSVCIPAGFAILTGWAEGTIHNFNDMIQQATAIYALSQIYYNIILKKDTATTKLLK